MSEIEWCLNVEKLFFKVAFVWKKKKIVAGVLGKIARDDA